MMQYHLNGFKPGNYEIPDAARQPATPPPQRNLPEHVDVLIIGCGPAGLTLARQLAEFSDITTCIVDKKHGPMLFGQADGISCRTMEIMEAFNSSSLLAKEAYQLRQDAFWEPDALQPNHIKRTHKVPDARLGLSEFVHSVVNQARLHDILLEGCKHSITHLIPYYDRELIEVAVDETLSQDLTAYPITATFKRTDAENEPLSEQIKARYIVGCDGARSTVRKNLGIKLEGDSAHKAWGVMDVLPVTNFPDIRVKSFIQSKAHGAVMLVPREGGYLVRLYVELDLLDSNQRASQLHLTSDDIIAKAKLIFSPYEFAVKEVAWWSIYEVGQRVAESFDNATANNPIPRAFVAGDACHTHSPKGGWGLNTSLQDTFNLGWKLAAVIQGKTQANLLQTYSTERRKVAQMLIDADRKMSALVATNPSAEHSDDAKAKSTADIERFIARQNGFIAGTSIGYDSSYLCQKNAYQHLASGFPIGQRFHSIEAMRIADACPIHLGHLIKADGRWRIFLFAGAEDFSETHSEIGKLMHYLTQNPVSPLHQYTPTQGDIDSVIDVYPIFQQTNLAIEDLPEYYCPRKGKLQLRDYEKIFYTPPQHALYKQRGINQQQGCMVVVRPDQHVATILPLNAHQALADFFAEFMLPVRPIK